MRCDDAMRAFWLAGDGEALAPEAARHLAECAACRAAVTAAGRCVERAGALPEEPLSGAARGRAIAALSPAGSRRPGRLLLAACAAVAAAVLLAVVVSRSGPLVPEPGPRKGVPSAPAATAGPEDVYAETKDAVERRLEYLEWDMTSSVAEGVGGEIDSIKQRIADLERTVVEPPRRGIAPTDGGAADLRGAGPRDA